MIMLLTVGLGVGFTFNLAGISNTATTFLVFYLVEKWVELHLEKGWNGWILILAGSILLYRIALYLHIHPEFVASLFDATI